MVRFWMSPGRMRLSPQCMLTNRHLRINFALKITFPALKAITISNERTRHGIGTEPESLPSFSANACCNSKTQQKRGLGLRWRKNENDGQILTLG